MSLTLPWLLVATPQLIDPNFQQTVVLVLEHGAEGSVGFVLNRPLTAPLAALIQRPQLAIPPEVAAWYGGPVDTGTGLILQDRTPDENRGEDRPLSLTVTSSEADLAALAAEAQRRLAAGGGDVLCPFRFLIGYAGWGGGQLEDELKAGGWIQVQATWTLIFNTPWSRLWDVALATVGASAQTLTANTSQYLN